MTAPPTRTISYKPTHVSPSRRLKLALRSWQGRVFYPRFQRIKERTAGMMPASVYQHIYRTVRDLPDGDIVEIGGGAGAGSVCAALALKESGKRGGLVTVEKCEGGSRTIYGGYKENLEIFREHMEVFGVSDRVTLFPHYLSDENAPEVHALIKSEKIAGMMCDADGRIDRDMALFLPRMMDGAMIMIDDYVVFDVNSPEVRAKADQHAKFVVTVKLVHYLESIGAFERTRLVAGTLFGRKPVGADASRIDRAETQRIVEEAIASVGSGITL